MKKLIVALIAISLITACKNYSNEYDRSQRELAIARDSIKILEAHIAKLSYPANQRLKNINQLINSGLLDSATIEIDELLFLFPKSDEAQMEAKLKNKISIIRQAKIEEENRRKALGFKALKDNPVASFDDIKASFSGFRIANTFTFDNYGSEYRYLQADKNCKYVSASMNITSTDSNPKLPQCAIYFVEGDVLSYRYDSFSTHFARWDDYGSYLGNYADYNNDFSKVNTVRFKIGVELKDEDLKQPFVIVMKKEGVLERTYNSFARPEISYSGLASFASAITLSDVSESGDYVIIKKYNFDKL